jgi:hypothetical protein
MNGSKMEVAKKIAMIKGVLSLKAVKNVFNPR